MSISETMRNIEALFRKHEKEWAGSYAIAPRKEQTQRVLTVEEHDRIYAEVAGKKDSSLKLAQKLGWSNRLIHTIRKKEHRHYDPIRSEAFRKEQ